jgi:hypothetical protein
MPDLARGGIQVTRISVRPGRSASKTRPYWQKRVGRVVPNFHRPRDTTVLVVLFVPSVERDGVTAVDQPRWVNAALEMFGRVFGGATAYPKAQGIWRDDERGGALVKNEPVVVHCYTTPADIEDARNLAELGDFCGWVAKLAKARSAWWSATSTSPSATSPRSR